MKTQKIKDIEKIVFHRFYSESEIKEQVEKTLNLKIISMNKEDMSEKDDLEFKPDYSFLLDIDANILGEEYCMLTIWYLRDREKRFLITEVQLLFE